MSFNFIETQYFKDIQINNNDELQSRKMHPYISNPTSFSFINNFTVINRKNLENSNKKDYVINEMVIKKFKEYPLICKHSQNNESFTMSAYICDIHSDITVPKYKETRKKIHYNYNVKHELTDISLFTVGDIIKYYYYTNKHLKRKGFYDESEYERSQLWNVVKKTVLYTPSPNNYPFGICHKFDSPTGIVRMYVIKNNKYKWDFNNFMNQSIIISPNTFQNPKIAHNLLYIYLYGDNKQDVKYEYIELDEPMTLYDVIHQYEDVEENNNIGNFIEKINKKLTGKQKEQLERYPEMIIPKKKLTLNMVPLVEQRWVNRLNESKKLLSYPIFAFRNIYVIDWIPNHTVNIILNTIDKKIYYQQNPFLKYISNKQGKYIEENPTNFGQCYGRYYSEKDIKTKLYKQLNNDYVNNVIKETVEGPISDYTT